MAFLIDATGPTVVRTYVFPDANATILTSNTAVTVAQGGTGITSAGGAGTVLVGGSPYTWSASPTLTTVKASFYISTAISALTVTTNTIAPTALIHQLGAGLIKTITVPATMASPGFLMILPTAAFTYDATGNILVPSGGGTAVINRLMIFAWDGTKFTPNY